MGAYDAYERKDDMSDNFEKDLTRLINRHSLENQSDTPDYILAKFMESCLGAYNAAVRSRDAWYSFDPWSKITEIVERKTNG